MNNETSPNMAGNFSSSQQNEGPASFDSKPKGIKRFLIPVIIAVVFFFLGIVAAYLFLSVNQLNNIQVKVLDFEKESTGTPTPTPSGTSVFSTVTPTPDPVADITKDWESYSNDEYTFKYPKSANLDTKGLAPYATRVTFMGQQQIDSGRTQTELWDGYTVTISKKGELSGKTLKQVVHEDIASSKSTCPVTPEISEPTQTTFDQKPAYQFTDSCMGEATQIYLNNSGTVYIITQLTAGDDEHLPGYKETTNQIAETIKFL
jgi:hypothetical protein